jgi:hypothetical protein
LGQFTNFLQIHTQEQADERLARLREKVEKIMNMPFPRPAKGDGSRPERLGYD